MIKYNIFKTSYLKRQSFNVFMIFSLLLFILFISNNLYAKENTEIKRKDNTFIKFQSGCSTLQISGIYRVRGEIQDEYNIKSYGTGTKEDYLLSRLRLHLDMKLSRKIRFFLEIQDSEVLGLSFEDSEFRGKNNPYHDTFDINKAYMEYTFLKGASLKIGRQSISFRDRRIFGPGDWGNTGRYAWDAIRIRYNDEHIDTNWIVGRYIIHNPDYWPNEQINGITAFATYNTIKKLPFQLDLFYVLKNDIRGITKGERRTGNVYSHNVGFRIEGKTGHFNYNATIVKEFGEWAEDTLDAYGIVVTAGYTFDTKWKPHLILQYVIGSGDKDPKDGEHGTFDGVFSGADTVLYGWMNLFFWKNLREHRLDLVLTPNTTTTLRAEYHYFMLDKAKDAWYSPGRIFRRDETGSSGRELGHEVDLTAKKKISNYMEVIGGYCFFIPGKFVKNTGPSPMAHWYFLQTTFFF